MESRKEKAYSGLASLDVEEPVVVQRKVQKQLSKTWLESIAHAPKIESLWNPAEKEPQVGLSHGNIDCGRFTLLSFAAGLLIRDSRSTTNKDAFAQPGIR